MPLYSALSGPSVAYVVQFSCLSARKEFKLEQVQGRASVQGTGEPAQLEETSVRPV